MTGMPSPDQPDLPLDESLLGDPDAGGQAGQGGMSRDDDNQAEADEEGED